jgi:Zn-dependent protease with chaperone function
MDSMLSGSEAKASGIPPNTAKVPTYFDGLTNRRHTVVLGFGSDLEISEGGSVVAAWPFDDLRAVASSADRLRLKCLSARPLARLEVLDPTTQAEIRLRARHLDTERTTGKQKARIVGWSLAAIVSIAAIAFFGVPLAAERLLPLVPVSFERHLGDMADNQVRTVFGGKVCTDPAGNAAFAKLVQTLRQAAHVDAALRTEVLASPIPNAFALRGGKIYLLSGLLQEAHNPDEIAGVIAHEMGHVVHRDQTRLVIESGGMAFLVGLLFGDITGSSAAIFTTRTLFQSSYSREAEANADAFAIDTMHALGRSPAPLGDLLFRITGDEGGRMVGILASHPLTEERRELMRREDRPTTGPAILSDEEWRALKAACLELAK